MTARKIICLFLALVFMLTISTLLVYAEEKQPVTEKGLFIEPDEAITIGFMFVSSNLKYLDCNWTENTRVEEIIPLFNVDDKINAYCIRLSTEKEETGYITVSAWSGIDFILEFAYSGNPVFMEENYPNCELNSEHLYYNGGIIYSSNKDIAIASSDLLLYSQDIVKKNEKILSEIHSNGTIPMYIAMAGDNQSGGYITTPVLYLQNVYGTNTYSYIDGTNLTAYSNHLMQNTNDCPITALAGVIYTNRYSITGSYPSWYTIYDDCFDVATDTNLTGVPYYTSNIGIPLDEIEYFIEDVLDYYNCSWTVAFKITGVVNKCISEVNAGRASCISVAFQQPYANHTMDAYGYARYTDPATNIYTFIRVKDGYSTGVRYLYTPTSGIYSGHYIYP